MRRSFSPGEIWCPLGRYLAPWLRVCLLGAVILWSVGVYRPYRHGFSTFICFVLFLRLASMYPMLGSNFYIDEGDLELSCLHTPRALAWQACTTLLGLCTARGGNQGLVHTRQACYSPSYSPQSLPSFIVIDFCQCDPRPTRTALLFGTPVAP